MSSLTDHDLCFVLMGHLVFCNVHLIINQYKYLNLFILSFIVYSWLQMKYFYLFRRTVQQNMHSQFIIINDYFFVSTEYLGNMAHVNISLFDVNSTANTTTVNENTTTNQVYPSVFDLNLLLMSGPLYFSYHEKVIMIWLLVVLFVLCVTGNFLTLFFITRDRMYTPTLTAIACHAFADFMLGTMWFGQAIYTLSVGNTHHFSNYKVSCFVERAFKVFWALGQTQNLSVLAFERLLYFKYPYLYTRLISVKKVLAAEISIYILAFVYVLCNALLGDSYYSVSILHCSLYNVPWYYSMTVGVWIIPPALVVILMVVTLSLLILKQLNQIHAMSIQVAAPPARQKENVANEAENMGKVKLASKDESQQMAPHANGATTSAIFTIETGGDDVQDTDKALSRIGEIVENEMSHTDVSTNTAGTCNSKPQKTVNNKPQKIVNNKPQNTVNNTPQSTVNSGTSAGAQSSDGNNTNSACRYMIKTMKTAIKLVGCISLSFYLTYIPSMIATLSILGKVSIVDLELGRYPAYFYLMRVFYFFALTISTVINPFFHFYFNRPLKRALYKMMKIKIPVEWMESTRQ